MSTRSVLHAGICVALLCYGQPANAEEKFDVTWLSECKSATANDPSLLSKKTVPPGADCRVSPGTDKRIVDTRLGVEWPMPKGSSEPKAVRSIESDPLSTGDYKACVRAHPPKGDVIDEWIVPAGKPCDGRDERSVFYRRYKDGKVCLMPVNLCVEVDKLDATGKSRVHEVIVSTLSSR